MQTKNPDCGNAAILVCGVLGLAPCHDEEKPQAGTSIQRPGSISQNFIAVFVGCKTMTFPAAPCTEMYPGKFNWKGSFTSVQTFHTHTHPAKRGLQLRPGLWDENGDDKEMKMRWKWRWDESYLTGTQRGGTQKKKERENTNTNSPARSGRTLKRQGKRKSGDGRGRTRLNKPPPAKPKLT